jgi:hypothetical protein
MASTEHQVLGIVVDVVEQLSPVVAAAVGVDVDVLHQEVVLVVAFLARVVHLVLGVVVDTVEVLDRIVVVVVEAAVDGLLGEVASRSQLRLSVVGPERNLVLMGERPKARVSLAVADVSQRSFRRLEVEDYRPVACQIVQLVLQVVFRVAFLVRSVRAQARADLNVRLVLLVVSLVRSIRARAETGLNVRRVLVAGVVQRLESQDHRRVSGRLAL